MERDYASLRNRFQRTIAKELVVLLGEFSCVWGGEGKAVVDSWDNACSYSIIKGSCWEEEHKYVGVGRHSVDVVVVVRRKTLRDVYAGEDVGFGRQEPVSFLLLGGANQCMMFSSGGMLVLKGKSQRCCFWEEQNNARCFVEEDVGVGRQVSMLLL